MGKHIFCTIADLVEEKSLGFDVKVNGKVHRFLAVKKNSCLRVFYNTCPHIGAPLNILPNKFLDSEKKHILCSNHGALFNLEDGYCIKGPCIKKSLTPAKFEVEDGRLFVHI